MAVIRISLPNPHFEQSNNVYLIADEELALIDTDETSEVLKKALAQAGFSIKEIKKIFITHKHPDHFGMASRIQNESGAERPISAPRTRSWAGCSENTYALEDSPAGGHRSPSRPRREDL